MEVDMGIGKYTISHFKPTKPTHGKDLYNLVDANITLAQQLQYIEYKNLFVSFFIIYYFKSITTIII